MAEVSESGRRQQGSCLPGAVETEARTLAAGSALEAGAAHKARESKSAEGIIKPAALTSLLAAPTMGEAESEGFRTVGHQTQREDGWTAEKSTGKSLRADWRCLQLPSPL